MISLDGEGIREHQLVPLETLPTFQSLIVPASPSKIFKFPGTPAPVGEVTVTAEQDLHSPMFCLLGAQYRNDFTLVRVKY